MAEPVRVRQFAGRKRQYGFDRIEEMQHTRLNPEIPPHLFVGTLEGEATCTPDDAVYDIWPKLLVIVLLQGTQHFIIDNASFRIDAGTAERPKPLILMLNIARFAKLRFINESNIPLRKIQISAPLPWTEKLMGASGEGIPPLRDFLDTHLAQFSFKLDHHALVLAEQMMCPPPSMQGEMLTLFKNSRALDIMNLTCAALVRSHQRQGKPRMQIRQRCEYIKDYILKHLGDDLTIERIAREAGASVSWVQRHFLEEFGTGVFDFVRASRLQVGRDALENDGATIAQAAYAAGYSDASNFSAAFKRAFGFSPKEARR
ncbi:MAG: AraC family transcriptional regulator [Mesorhizobium sp.]